MKLTESDIVTQCCDYLRWKGWFVIDQPSGLLVRPSDHSKRMRVGQVGCSDKIAVKPLKPGVCLFFYLEFKAPGERLDPAQVEWHLLKKEQGFLTRVVNDVDELVVWLDEEFGDLMD